MRGKRLLTDALAREHQPRDLPVHRSNAEPDLTPNISSSSAAWHYSYDLMGHQTGATPPTNAYSPLASTSNSYGLSGAGRLDTTTTGTRGTTYYYDVAGRQYKTDVTTSTTLTTTLTLDSLGRQTSISTGSGGDLLAETYDAVNRLTSISRASLSITTFTYNADGTAATRTDRDGAGTAHLNTFTYTTLGQLANAGLPDSAGSAAYTWGLDGNMATRTWGSSAITGTYRYDGAKRPISLTIARTGQGQNDVISRTYDLVGNVTAETQTLARSGGSGSRNPTLAYGQTESFTYDAANRVTASSFDGSVPEARTYTYDADGNRRSVTEAGVTFYYFYDATDAVVTKKTPPTSHPRPRPPAPTAASATTRWAISRQAHRAPPMARSWSRPPIRTTPPVTCSPSTQGYPEQLASCSTPWVDTGVRRARVRPPRMPTLAAATP